MLDTEAGLIKDKAAAHLEYVLEAYEWQPSESRLASYYIHPKSRMDLTSMHEGIEIGLKALLRSDGVPEEQSTGHNLYPLIAKLQKRDPTTYAHLDRCARAAMRYCKAVDPTAEVTSVSDYCKRHGTSDAYIRSRYWSVETHHPGSGVRMAVYVEIVRAILAALLGTVHRDVYARIEGESTNAVLEAGELDPSVDWALWVDEGAVHTRLENIKLLEATKVLRIALRKCAVYSDDAFVRGWANQIRVRRLEEKRGRGIMGFGACHLAEFPCAS